MNVTSSKLGAALLACALTLSAAGMLQPSTALAAAAAQADNRQFVKQMGVVVRADEASITMKSVIWKLNGKTIQKASSGRPVGAFRSGDLVKTKNTGMVALSLPGKGLLTEIVKYDGSFARRVSQALRAFIETRSASKLYDVRILDLQGAQLTVQFSEIDKREAQRAVLDITKPGTFRLLK